MPLIYEYECSPWGPQEIKGKIIQGKCDFVIRDYGPYMCVKLDEKEVVLPHPIEERRAKSLTGKNLNQLVKEGRIIFRKREFCLKCLKTKEECDCEKPDLIEIPKLEGRECPKCHKGTILKTQAGIS